MQTLQRRRFDFPGLYFDLTVAAACFVQRRMATGAALGFPLLSIAALLGLLVGRSMQAERLARRSSGGSDPLAAYAAAAAHSAARHQALCGAAAFLIHMMIVSLKIDWSTHRPRDLLALFCSGAVIAGMLVAPPLLLPAHFVKKRAWFAVAARVLFFSMPNIRNPKGIPAILQVRGRASGAGHAAAQATPQAHAPPPLPGRRALQAAPSRHRLGVLRDLWVIGLGGRRGCMCRGRLTPSLEPLLVLCARPPLPPVTPLSLQPNCTPTQAAARWHRCWRA